MLAMWLQCRIPASVDVNRLQINASGRTTCNRVATMQQSATTIVIRIIRDAIVLVSSVYFRHADGCCFADGGHQTYLILDFNAFPWSRRWVSTTTVSTGRLHVCRLHCSQKWQTRNSTTNRKRSCSAINSRRGASESLYNKMQKDGKKFRLK